eukprot:TRINITY_DN12853_c0_g1_i1.p1 TRINITY_DN12853_c0_g1~~TRINITY_DN12853_c0_g1_i1.p1  ORF type:complete len:818 (-),score=184.86 TRINITY_DN12853_c0_g1_i1:23-2476(-)
MATVGFQEIQDRLRGMDRKVKCLTRLYQLGPVKLSVSDWRTNVYGDDDKLYKNRDLWETLPRGLAFVNATLGEANSSCVLHGLRKFGYEQDDYIEPYQDIAQEVYTVKENGECMHISAVNVGGQHVWIIGSKNVHVPLRSVADLELPEFKENRTMFASKMARLFFALLSSIAPDRVAALGNALAQNGWTLCGEAYFAGSQHIVDYAGRDGLAFYALSRCASSNQGLTAVPPLDTINLLRSWGLPVVEFAMVPLPRAFPTMQLQPYVPHTKATAQLSKKEERKAAKAAIREQYAQKYGKSTAAKADAAADAVMEEAAPAPPVESEAGRVQHIIHAAPLACIRDGVRSMFETIGNCEGAVVYALDSNGVCRKMYKHKNYAYIVERAVRQIALRNGLTADIRKRMANLHISHPDIPPLIDELTQFNAWLHSALSVDDWPNLMGRWVDLRRQFRAVPLEERLNCLQSFEERCTSSSQLQVVLVGLVGSGKSTLGFALAKVLGGEYVNQDALGALIANFQREAKRATQKVTCPIVVLDKCHHNEDQRERTLTVLHPGQLMFMEIMHREDGPFPEKTAVECAKRIAGRANHHFTLVSGAGMFQILDGFASSWQPIEDRSNVARIDMMITPVEMLRCALQEVATRFPTLDAGQRAAAALANPALLEEAVAATQHREQQIVLAKSKVIFLGADMGCLDGLIPLPIEVQQRIDATQYSVLERHHTTLAVTAGDVDETTQAVAKQLEGRAGERCAVTVRAIVWDDHAVALLVEHGLPCVNRIAHVTFALAAGTKPAYSNEMLKQPHNTMQLREPLVFEGVIMKYFSK